MVQLDAIRLNQDYICQRDLNLYKSPACDGFVTQAASGRHLRFLAIPESPNQAAIAVCLCEDDYPGWLATTDAVYLTPAPDQYRFEAVTAEAIQAKIPSVIQFAHAAMAQPNSYLWGGTVAPSYDCSGLMQAAFASVGIVLPRDSYQQKAFVEPVAIADLQPGDLIFFGTRDRITHVALYLGEGCYIHSSGKEQGRNGIGIDSIKDLIDPVSAAYYHQLQGAGRVTRSYESTGEPITCR